MTYQRTVALGFRIMLRHGVKQTKARTQQQTVDALMMTMLLTMLWTLILHLTKLRMAIASGYISYDDEASPC